MSTTSTDWPLTEWDLTIERAQRTPYAEDKLAETAALLAAAQQWSRLRGEFDRVDELGQRLRHVYELLDQV